MRLLILWLLITPVFAASQNTSEIQQWQRQASQVTIIEDDWGIPHIYGKTDADAVFGLMYVQCMQNFARVEENHIEMFGRLSEVHGKNRLYDDLQMKLIYDTAAAKKDYAASPQWFKRLMDAYADGINYYLYKNPSVRPMLINRFEPWFALMRTNGSISSTQTGGISLSDLRNMYPLGDESTTFIERKKAEDYEPTGSNGFAVAPSRSKSGNAVLYINPHTSFYYRTEVHVVSDEGLNAYGGVTWGTFFVFQGFNENCGWMHTSSYSDVADLFRENISLNNNQLYYTLDGRMVPVLSKKLTLRYKDGNQQKEQNITTYATHHGPVMGKRNGEWLAVRENNRSLNALLQSWLRTKAKGFQDFKKVMDLRSNSSDNTVFADSKGNIAYWHGNFIPKRDRNLDYSQPVDGSTSATDWKGVHTLEEMVHVYNPKSGFIQNCNATPFTVAGASSPKKENYPKYMAPDGQNGRGITAARLLSKAQDVTIDKMITIGYNTYLSAFEFMLPALFKAYDALPASDSLKKRLEEPIRILKSWDMYASASSIATTLAMESAPRWERKVTRPRTDEEASDRVLVYNKIASLPASELLITVRDVLVMLENDYGTWKVGWGDVNRYQRSNNNQFDDNRPSLPVGLGGALWGSLPAYRSERFNTKKRYGYNGNSFIAAVEFGKKIKAKTILVSGESFDPNSKHYTDQAEGYINGIFKDIYFYKDDVLKHAERQYHPGEENRPM